MTSRECQTGGPCAYPEMCASVIREQNQARQAERIVTALRRSYFIGDNDTQPARALILRALTEPLR